MLRRWTIGQRLLLVTLSVLLILALLLASSLHLYRTGLMAEKSRQTKF